MINAILFPYGCNNNGRSVELKIENMSHIKQVLDGDADEAFSVDGYTFFINFQAVDEEFKFQPEYGIYGNFLICRLIGYNEFEPLKLEQIEYLKNNVKEILSNIVE